MELNQYLNMFLEESKEHLQTINERLLQLEENPNDLVCVQEIFRSAHTLKGMAATMGFEDITHVTHEMENLLDLIRNQSIQIVSSHMDILFACVDQLESMVQNISAGGDGAENVEQLVTSLKRLVSGEVDHLSEHKETLAVGFEFNEYDITVMQQFSHSGLQLYQVVFTLRKDCILKAARAYMVFQALESHGEVIKTIPDVEMIEKELFDEIVQLVFITNETEELIEKTILNVSEIESASVRKLDLNTIRHLESAASTEIVEVDKPTENNATVSLKEISKPENKKTTSKTIRVDIERLDVLMNLFSELIIDRGRLEQIAQDSKRADLTETVEHLSRISGDLQNIILTMRMIPIDQVFNRFPRMIRDLAKDLNKKVDLQIDGAETELDRTVIDEIGDPLVHILRNAVDHGLETGIERINNGKPETGTIKLRAYHSGNHVFIEIEDDGKGIDRTKVLSKAIERNIVTLSESKSLTDKEVYHLLFAPGFSTAETISDISGRGVGLDVVKTKIESLGGSFSINSELNRGTLFSIQLPLTLSIISALLVGIGKEKYAIPLNSIVETADFSSSQVKWVHNQRVIDFRGKVVPLISLVDILKVEHQPDVSGNISVVIIKKGEKLAGLIVNSLFGQQEIVLKSLSNYLDQVFAISGATILGDGQVALILDCNALIN